MAINSMGFDIPTLDQIIEDIGNRQKKVFPDINISPATPDGQLNGLLAEAIMVAFENNLAIYSGLDPNTAEGIMLDRVCSITGIFRKDGFPSIATLEFSGVPGTLIPSGTIFSDNNQPKNEYSLTSDVTLDSNGSGTGIANSTVNGPVFSGADQITNIETLVDGLGTVTNPDAVITGREKETDKELRTRRYKSVALPGTALLDSVYAEIMNTEGVIDCAVYENTESTASPEGIPPHSIFPVVFGGTDKDISSAIMRSKSLGCGLYGDITTEWTDLQGHRHVVTFQRPVATRVYIHIEVVADTFDNSVEEDVKDRIMNYINGVRNDTEECAFGRMLIGDDVYAASFYYPFHDAAYSIANVLVGDTSPGDANLLQIDMDSISSFSRDDIEVIEYTGGP